MIIKPGLAAIAAVSSAVLTFGNTAHAAGPDFLGYPPSIASSTQIVMSEAISEPPVEYPMLPEPLPPIPAEATPQLEAPEITAIATEATVPVVSKSAVSTSRSYTSSGNTYAWGYCTWYAKSKRPDLPNNLGNAGRWVANAAAHGFATGTTPRAGAVGEQAGHVVYVESVNGDGTVTISEMNYNGGIGVVHTRTVAASSFTYIY